MNLFLIYLEIGKPIPPSRPENLDHRDVLVALDGRRGPARAGMTLTDGCSSERFKRFGARVADREGDRMRRALVVFLRHRLVLGAHPHLAFVWCDGPLASVTVNVDAKVPLRLDDLEGWLREAEPAAVCEVVS